MSAIFLSLTPVFLIILLGYGLRRSAFVGAEVWPAFDRLNYHILMPCLIINAVAQADLGAVPVARFGGVILLSALVVIGLLFVTRPFLNVTGPQFSSVFQAGLRWNGFVALATAVQMYGEESLGALSLAIAFLIPINNLASILVLTMYSSAHPPSPQQTVLNLVRNPLVISAAIGLALNVGGIGMPGLPGAFLRLLGSASLPLGLMSVGAALTLAALKGNSVPLAAASCVRLIAYPLIAFAFAQLFGITGMLLGVLIIASAVPTATSGYILARQLGGDPELMAGLIAITTLGAALTMPLMLVLLAPH